MKNAIVLLSLFVFILAGCNTAIPNAAPVLEPTATVTPEKATVSNPVTGSLFAINEIGLGPAGYVSLTNFTDQPAALGGLFLCQASRCFALPETEVLPGRTVRIATGDGSGIEGVVAANATLGELQPSDGEVGLYASTDVTDPRAILAYLQWGSTPHENTAAAIQAGLWLEGAFSPSSDRAIRLFRTDGGLWLFEE
jgi:hypothetical protein